MEAEAVKSLLELGTQGLFLFLFIRADVRLQTREEAYQRDYKDLSEKRVQEARQYLTRTPTNLEG